MTKSKTFVIVGGGLAGARAAEALRLDGFDGRLALVADEPALPYKRPPLPKGYLAGGRERIRGRAGSRRGLLRGQ